MASPKRILDDILAAARGDDFGGVGEAADDAHAGEAGGRGGGEGTGGLLEEGLGEGEGGRAEEVVDGGGWAEGG